MADYPSVGQHQTTIVKPADRAVEQHKATNGVVMFYDLGEGAPDQFMITVYHMARSLADRNTIISHWDAHKSPIVIFNFTDQSDSQVYQCNYIRRPGYVWNPGNNWNITTELFGTI